MFSRDPVPTGKNITDPVMVCVHIFSTLQIVPTNLIVYFMFVSFTELENSSSNFYTQYSCTYCVTSEIL